MRALYPPRKTTWKSPPKEAEEAEKAEKAEEAETSQSSGESKIESSETCSSRSPIPVTKLCFDLFPLRVERAEGVEQEQGEGTCKLLSFYLRG